MWICFQRRIQECIAAGWLQNLSTASFIKILPEDKNCFLLNHEDLHG